MIDTLRASRGERTSEPGSDVALGVNADSGLS